MRYRLDVELALRDGTDPLLLPRAASYMLKNFWEKVGLLCRREVLYPWGGC